jgi:hypothetical protein
MRRLFYRGVSGCVSVYDHARKREAIDKEIERSRKRAGKRKYRYDRRTRAAASENKKTEMLSLESVARVIVEQCCTKDCTRKFSIPTIRALRTEMHLQTFQAKSTRNLDVHRMTHKGVGREKELVTLEGIDVCLHAWRSIHNVSLRTFQRYKAKAAADVRGGPHGNLNLKKIRTATIQAIETLRMLLEAAADYMPHLSRTLRTGEKVGLKVLPAGTEWKQLLASVNEV